VTSVSVVIPVLNGERYLAEVLGAISGQRYDGDVDVLVIDSDSTDGSVRIARDAGAPVLQIERASFGHGATRNLGAEVTAGDFIAYLTQDATPASDLWLHHLTAPLTADERVGLVFGPHLPRDSTSPMIARELAEFFQTFSPNGSPVVEGLERLSEAGSPFFSNVNSCVRRTTWASVRFRDVMYAEDQAFAADALRRGWLKVFEPDAAVLHAHDYGPIDFMRRYFDEYRGLYETIGHVEAAHPRALARVVAAQVRADRRWISDHSYSGWARTYWSVRSCVHHAGRGVFAALGSRAHRLPPRLRGILSLEGRH
jgi:glycosyltransferase involved in cell wall biosynthesis